MAKVEFEQGQLWIKGRMTFDNADDLFKQGVALLQHQQTFPLAINVSDLEQGNTVALAVILQWLRRCRNPDDLYVVHMSEKMQRIVAASNLQFLLRP